MKTANGRRLAIHKRLHSEANAVHPLPQKLIERYVRELAWRALQRNLCIAGKIELSAQMLKQLPELLRRQQAGSSPSEINGIDTMRQTGCSVLHSGPRTANLLA